MIGPGHAVVPPKPVIPGSSCISNGLLSAEVRNVTDASQVGRLTLARGACPLSELQSNPDLILFPIGTSFNTVRVWDTQTDYSEGSVTTEPSFTNVNLDSQSPTL